MKSERFGAVKGKEVQHKGQVDCDLYMVDENDHLVVPYARILIRKKVGA